MALVKGLLNRTESPRHETQVKVKVIGQGKWRHLAFSDEKEDSTLDYNIKPKLSLSFARQYLLNALHMLGISELKYNKPISSKNSFPEENSGHNSKSKDTNGSGQVNANGDTRAHSTTTTSNTLSEYEEICLRDSQKIKQAILIDLVFIELELGNPLMALSTALTVLKLPECSRMYAFCTHGTVRV